MHCVFHFHFLHLKFHLKNLLKSFNDFKEYSILPGDSPLFDIPEYFFTPNVYLGAEDTIYLSLFSIW